ncbi:MAG: molecular chaperone HtpG, partial [Bacteroidetes bacterium]|nr:molecular chaperone HtpG [Bacteroidota bacterium]
KNTDGKYFTLTEYPEQVKANQTDKSEQQVWLYTTHPGQQDAYVQSAKRRSYDVLELGSPLDSHFVNQLERKLEKTSLKRVDADTIDKLIEKDEKLESVLSKEQEEKVKTVFEETVGDKSKTVQVSPLAPDELPVTLTMPEFMRRMKDMSMMQGMAFSQMPDSYQLTVNANHPLINKLAGESDADKQKALARQAYDLALLSQDMLQGAALTEFIRRSTDMLVK